MNPRLLLGMFCAVALSLPARAASLNWMSDLEAAKARSAKEQKPLLVEFTGSTWCPPCKELAARVFSTSEFAEFAREVVLVSLDYPVLSARTPEKIRADPELARLMEIKAKYEVPGFPTLLYFDAAGRQRSKTVGYSGEAAPIFIAKIKGEALAASAIPNAPSGGAGPRPSLRGPLSPEQVQVLEEKLKADPEDIAARRQLVEHYTREQYGSPELRRVRQQHILWLIEHDPKVELRGPDFSLHAQIDGDAYETGKQLWAKQLDAHPEDVELLDRAANYLLLNDRHLAEQFWQKAEALEPTNPHWPERLAHLYSLSGNTRTGTDRAAAHQALIAMERARSRAKDGEFNFLVNLAKMAFAAGESEKAREYASRLLEQAPQHVGQWNYGNAIHDANAVLGRVALQNGKIDEAKEFLLAAGKTPGSPQLNSFGPNMSLANDLAQKGESETVLRYFELCRAFWKMGGDRLDRWSEAVRNGRTPDFGANLRY